MNAMMSRHKHAGPVMRTMCTLILRYGPGQITCREFDEFIVDYVDGVLPERSRRVFENHLRICPMCRAYLDGYRRTMALGRAALGAASEPVPADVPDDLVKAILAARRAAPTD
jgi:anti-sigma factor RsiW